MHVNEVDPAPAISWLPGRAVELSRRFAWVCERTPPFDLAAPCSACWQGSRWVLVWRDARTCCRSFRMERQRKKRFRRDFEIWPSCAAIPLQRFEVMAAFGLTG